MIYIDGIKIETLEYPSGEWGISNFDKLPKQPKVIQWITEKGWEREYVLLTLLDFHLDFKKTKLKVDFLPLSREDKTENGRVNLIFPLALKLGCIFNDQLIEVETFHPTKLFDEKKFKKGIPIDLWLKIDNSKLHSKVNKEMRDILENSNGRILIIYPDESSCLRNHDGIFEFAFKPDYLARIEIMTVSKKRDKITGKIIDSKCFDEEHKMDAQHFKPTHVIMVDDICSYGGSFARIANELNEILGYKPLYDLFVYADEKQTPNKAIEAGINIHSIKDIKFKNETFNKQKFINDLILHMTNKQVGDTYMLVKKLKDGEYEK